MNLFRKLLSRWSRTVSIWWGFLVKSAFTSGFNDVLSQSNHLSCCELFRFWPPKQKMYHTAALHDNSWQSSLTTSTVFSEPAETESSSEIPWNSDASKIFKPDTSLGRVINFILLNEWNITSNVTMFRKPGRLYWLQVELIKQLAWICHFVRFSTRTSLRDLFGASQFFGLLKFKQS